MTLTLRSEKGSALTIAEMDANFTTLNDAIGTGDAAATAAAEAAAEAVAEAAIEALTASDVGLGNVDNTADADKPISDATQSELDAQDTRIEVLEDIFDDEELLTTVTAADVLNRLVGPFAYSPAAVAETFEPLTAVNVSGVHNVDASLGRRQVFNATDDTTLTNCTETYGELALLYIADNGAGIDLAKSAAWQGTGGATWPIAVADGDEVYVKVDVFDAGGTTRYKILSVSEDSPAPLVDAEITSTSISPPWSNTAGATFTITENGVGNPTPDKSRTFTFNGVATADTATTFSGPTGKKGGFVVTSTWDNVDGMDGAEDTATTECWIGKRQPKYIGAVTAQNHGGAGPGAEVLTLPGGTLEGHTFVLYTCQQSSVDIAPPAGFSALDAAIQRIALDGTVSGNNHHFQIFTAAVTADHITAGTLTVQVQDNSYALLEVWSDGAGTGGVDTAVWVSDTEDTHWTREGPLNANDIDTPAFTTDDAAILIAVMWGSHFADKAKVASAPAGWTANPVNTSTNANASAAGIRTFWKQVSNETTASINITTSGAADATLQSSMLALYGPANS